MEKTPCMECGALILPATAASTGGICMACKQDIRKSMNASRSYYKTLEIYDPYRELWNSLVDRSSLDTRLANFSVYEQKYFAINLLEREVYNGGFEQFFSNTSCNYYCLAVDGLEVLGALNSLNIVKEAACAIFGKHRPPVDQAERWQIMEVKARHLSEVLTRYRQTSQLECLDKQFWQDPDGLGKRLKAYAEQQGLIEPFLKEAKAN